MKRTLLALAIPALLAANVADANIEFINKDGNILNMYGRVQAENTISKQGNDNGDNSYIRIGFNGVTQITDLLSGYGRIEYQAYAGKDQSYEARYAYAGLDFGSYGSFDYGRNDGVSKMITSYTDVLPQFGGDAGDMILLGARENAVATYRNQGLFGLVDGLNFAIQYADRDNRTNETRDLDDNGNGYYTRDGRQAYGISAEYANILDSGVTLGGAYAMTSKANAITPAGLDMNNSRSQSWVVGANYQYANLYVAALYNYAKNIIASAEVSQAPNFADPMAAKSVKGYEMVVGYTVNLDVGAVTPRVAYIQDKGTPYGNGESQYLTKYVDLSLQYDFNKNFTAFVEYKINLLKSDAVGDINSKDSVALALQYNF